MRWAILDTNIYIGHWEHGMYEDLLSAVRKAFIVRHSAIVLSELRRGARTRDAQKLVADLWRIAAPWEPTSADWWEAGRLIRIEKQETHRPHPIFHVVAKDPQRPGERKTIREPDR